MVYRIKNFKNPPIDKDERKSYIEEFTAIFEAYLSFLEEKIDDLKPSSTKIPDEITCNLSKKEILKIVDKNPHDTVDSKSITTFEESLEHATTK